MMKGTFLLVLLVYTLRVAGQTDSLRLTGSVSGFHADLVNRHLDRIRRWTDPRLTYGHSNGWVESREDLLRNLETGVMRYEAFTTDSLALAFSGSTAQVRFIADIRAALNGAPPADYRLRVLEVWVKRGTRWHLFARQAVRRN
ncbi:MAG: hypothetical protein RJA57_1420 [Bacteroidota bacterium]|jgi:hypothetical protein